MTVTCVIVDDDLAVLRDASDVLEREGVAVVGVAASGEEALTLREQLAPDVMLVDIDLGPESGFDLTRRLVQSRERTGTRIILISTHDESEYADLIAASPAIGFLPKSDLSGSAIRRLLARAAGQDANER
jgi:DNA-binding NarL/FixJ family response regulator